MRTNTHSSLLSNEEDSLCFVGEGFSIPKSPNAACEDAFFIAENGAGVSDGVGGWNSYGINSSLFSNSLMRECSKFINRVQLRQQQS